MAEDVVINWDEINVDEEVNEDEAKAADDLSNKTPVGKFLCTITESKAKQRDFKNYSCYAAGLKMRIDEVLEIEKPVMDDKGKPVKKNGKILKKVQPLTDDELLEINPLHSGKFLFDDINLAHPKEKDAMKKRRIFVLKKCGVISGAQKITASMFQTDILEKQVIVTTETNLWKDKLTDEIKSNVRVAWDGYEYASMANKTDDDLDI